MCRACGTCGMKSRWEDNIEMDLKGMGSEGWSGFSWLRIGTSVRHVDELLESLKCGEFFD